MTPRKIKPKVRVVAALIQRPDGQVLITQRRTQAFMPLKWEFPGGKVEKGETDQEALARELKEELAIEVKIENEFMGLTHEYPEFIVDFHVYKCSQTVGTIQKIGVNDFKWVAINQLDFFDFPPADQPTVKKLLE